MIVLVVVAHPDDEVLMGGAIARFAAEGQQVFVLALADGETSRPMGCDPHGVKACQAIDQRLERHRAAARVLGFAVVEDVRNGSIRFPDQRLDVTPLLDITRIIERVIAEVQPSVVYTHSPGDLNSDHRRVYEAVLPAVRPKNGVREVYAFAGPRMIRFEPTSFWGVTEAQMDQQHQALLCYGDELAGEWEMIKARAVEYGYRVGVAHAEGFEVIREMR